MTVENDWQKVLHLIELRAPEKARVLRGVSEERLGALRCHSPRPLPDHYVQFMQLMGDGSADMPLFPSCDHLALALERDWQNNEGTPPYPTERYFKIAVSDDEPKIASPDYYLDLASGDALDAPVVGFEISPEGSIKVGYAFGDHALTRIFSTFERPGAAHEAFLAFGPTEAEPAGDLYARVMALLIRIGFSETLRGNLMWSGERPTVAVRAGLPQGGIPELIVRSDHHKDFVTLLEQLQDNLPVAYCNPQMGRPLKRRWV